MSRENVYVVPQVKKQYRLYIGRGIPDSWISYTCPINPKIFPLQVLRSNKNLHELLDCKSCGKFREELCLCCQKKYLFECPDECGSTFYKCTCEICHEKSNCLNVKCKCGEILRALKQRKSGISNELSCCEFSSHKGCNYDLMSNFNIREKEKECLKTASCENSCAEHEPLKKHPEVCFCPDIGHFSFKKGSQLICQNSSKLAKSYSKLVQVELSPKKTSKFVQTQADPALIQKEKSCCHCNISQAQIECSAVNSVPSFGWPLAAHYKCPYHLSNISSQCHYFKSTKQKFKKANRKENKDQSSSELQKNSCYGKIRNEESLNNSHKTNLNFNKYSTYSVDSNPDYYKWLTDSKIKSSKYVRPELPNDILFHRQFLDDRKNKLIHYRVPKGDLLRGWKTFSFTPKYCDSVIGKTLFHRSKFVSNSKKVDQATMTFFENTLNENSSHLEVFVCTKKQDECNRLSRKRRKLLVNRRRRRRFGENIYPSAHYSCSDENSEELVLINKGTQMEEIDKNYSSSFLINDNSLSKNETVDLKLPVFNTRKKLEEETLYEAPKKH